MRYMFKVMNSHECYNLQSNAMRFILIVLYFFLFQWKIWILLPLLALLIWSIPSYITKLPLPLPHLAPMVSSSLRLQHPVLCALLHPWSGSDNTSGCACVEDLVSLLSSEAQHQTTSLQEHPPHCAWALTVHTGPLTYLDTFLTRLNL